MKIPGTPRALTPDGLLDGVPELCRTVCGVGIERARLRLGRMPQHLMKLSCGSERGKHLALGVRAFEPARASEKPLRHVLACTEAVKDGAAAEAPRAEGVVDRAGEVRCQVVAGRACGLVDRKVCRT
jgi:hypothetical protein